MTGRFGSDKQAGGMEAKTAKQFQPLAFKIVRWMQGCGYVEAVKVTSDPRVCWVISKCIPATP
jgi:hypothetical protein